jgi:hypothetical protein
VRTGEAEYQGGRIYPIDPEAHAKLRAFWEAKDDPRPARESAPEPKTVGRASAARDGRSNRRIVLPPETLDKAMRRHEAGEPLSALAAEIGVSTITLILRLRETGYDTGRRVNPGRRGKAVAA